jgi:RHS repeat-associated protein
LDPETALHYFEARYYRNTHGRFTQVDPVSGWRTDTQSWNRYAYARNNPLKYTDPTGRSYANPTFSVTTNACANGGSYPNCGKPPGASGTGASGGGWPSAGRPGNNSGATHMIQEGNRCWWAHPDDPSEKYGEEMPCEDTSGPGQAAEDGDNPCPVCGSGGNEADPLPGGGGDEGDGDDGDGNDGDEGEEEECVPCATQAVTAIVVRTQSWWSRMLTWIPSTFEAARQAATISARYGIDVNRLTLTNTVANHLSERPYQNSAYTIRNIILSGLGRPDPQGVPGALRWDVPGVLNGTEGTFQLVIQSTTNTVLHFQFKGPGRK